MKQVNVWIGIVGLLSGQLAWAQSVATQTTSIELKPGDFIAMCGDSITAQRQYTVFVEDYLLMCRPELKCRVLEAGLGAERAGPFVDRMETTVLLHQPTVATTCYGMNDAAFTGTLEEKARYYHDNMQKVVRRFKEAGVRAILVGSPGIAEPELLPKDHLFRTMDVNLVLGTLRDEARKLAQEEGVGFADIHEPMRTVQAKGKAKYGPRYRLAGYDGVHPCANGHLVMAYAFLKALGCDGAIGTITLNLTAGNAQATTGHRVLSVKDGVVEVESTRYPFCTFGNPNDFDSTRSVIEFFPFHQELNRFLLAVPDAEASTAYAVTWGKEHKEFSGAQLAKGINLAAEFPDNPFGPAFHKVEEEIGNQQAFESDLIVHYWPSLGLFRKVLPDEVTTVDRLQGKLLEKDQQKYAKAAALVQPVKHTIKVEKVAP